MKKLHHGAILSGAPFNDKNSDHHSVEVSDDAANEKHFSKFSKGKIRT